MVETSIMEIDPFIDSAVEIITHGPAKCGCDKVALKPCRISQNVDQQLARER